MEAGTNLVGRSEKETLLNELEWLASWSQRILRIAKTQNSILGQIAAVHSINHSEDNLDQLLTLDTMAGIAAGGISVGKELELGLYRAKGSPDACIHQGLKASFERLMEQGRGQLPIPFDPVTRDVNPVEKISEEDKNKFAVAFHAMIKAREVMVGIIDKYFTSTPPKKDNENVSLSEKTSEPISLQIRMKIVDKNDNDVNPVGLGVDELVKSVNKPQDKD